jgi:hypothetical protein
MEQLSHETSVTRREGRIIIRGENGIEIKADERDSITAVPANAPLAPVTVGQKYTEDELRRLYPNWFEREGRRSSENPF